MIIRTGDTIEVLPGVSRRVIGLTMLQEEFDDPSTALVDGRSSGFNNRGEIAFTAFFEDGSLGIFVSDLVAIPEPAAFALLAVAIAAAAPARDPRR